MRQLFHLSILLLAFTPVAGAQDLDVDAAQSRYDRARSLADQAESEKDQAYRNLQPVKQRLDSAQSNLKSSKDRLRQEEDQMDRVQTELRNRRQRLSELQSSIQQIRNNIDRLEDRKRDMERQTDTAEQDVRSTQTELDRVNRQIRRLSDSNDEGWVCVAVDRGHEEHRGGHRGTGATRSAAEADAKESCLEFHGECRIARCNQKDNPRLKELKERRSTLTSQLSSQKAELERCRREIKNITAGIRESKNKAQKAASAIQSEKSRVAQLQGQVEQCRTRISQARSDLRRAEDRLDSARDAYLFEKPKYDSAVRYFRDKKDDESEALAYLQQVQRNYQNAKNQVIRSASNKASLDAGKEAQKRAGSHGIKEAKKDAPTIAKSKGLRDGARYNNHLGYVEGRQQGSSASGFASDYKAGVAQGKKLAQDESKLEDQPKGFNDAYASLIQQVPVKTDTIAMDEELPSQSGTSTIDLTGANRNVGSQSAPSYPIGSTPSVVAPISGDVTVRYLDPSREYYSPSCNNVPLSEFRSVCENAYKNSYSSSYRSQFASLYGAAYRKQFNATAKVVYDQTINSGFSSDRKSGKATGVRHQGILDGYKQSISALRAAAYKAGQSDFAQLVKKGHLIRFVSAELVDSNKDGVLMQNETAHLALVIDNLGSASSPAETLEVKVESKKGLAELNFSSREIPSLSANTRTTLTAVLSAKTIEKLAGAKISVRAAVLKSGGQIVAQFDAESTINFPIELTDIEVIGRAEVGKEAQTTFTFENKSNKVQDAATFKLSTSPNYVSFKEASIEVPELAPGETTKVDVSLTPGVWVDGDRKITFVAKKQGEEGDELYDQNVAKSLDVYRNAELQLFDRSGRQITTDRINVRAGQQVSVRLVMNFNANFRINGPFKIAYGRKSHDTIRAANNSTIGTTLGSWGPNQRHSGTWFSFIVPRDLVGQSGVYVMFVLKDGATTIHAPMLYLNVLQ